MNEDEAKRRLLAYTMLRFGGLAIFFLGVAIMYTKIVRPGGWPQLGAIVAIFGVLDGLLMPHLLKRRWDREDRESQ